MSKKLIFLLFVFSFISGLLLHEMLLGISYNLELDTDETVYYETTLNMPNVDETTPFEVVRIVTPKKAMRGYPFEMIVYLKTLSRVFGTYNLILNLNDNDNKNIKINAGRYSFVTSREWFENKIVKVGPFAIFLPEEAKAGKYNIEINLSREGEARVMPLVYADGKTISSKIGIEVVSYNK